MWGVCMRMTGKDNKTNTCRIKYLQFPVNGKGKCEAIKELFTFQCVCVWGGDLWLLGISFSMLIFPNGLPPLCTAGGTFLRVKRRLLLFLLLRVGEGVGRKSVWITSYILVSMPVKNEFLSTKFLLKCRKTQKTFLKIVST